MNIPATFALALAAALPTALQETARPPHHGHRHGEFPDFITPVERVPDLKVVLDDVDLASFGPDVTIWCRPSVGCSLKVSLAEPDAPRPFDSIQVKVPVAGADTGKPDSAGKWYPWKLNDRGESRTLPHHASVELLLAKPAGDPAGTFFVITKGTPASGSMEDTQGRSRIDPATARPLGDKAATVSFWLDGPARVEVRITREHDPKKSLYDHKVYPFLTAGEHEHRWQFHVPGDPKLVADMYVVRFNCTEQDPNVPVEVGCGLLRVVPARR